MSPPSFGTHDAHPSRAPGRWPCPGGRRALRDAAAASGHEVLPDPPHARPGLATSERDRFLTTVDRMMEAEMLVADASAPDAGVGWCVAWFLARGRLVVLTCRRDARASLSAMVAGNPSPWQRIVVYDAADELRGPSQRRSLFD